MPQIITYIRIKDDDRTKCDPNCKFFNRISGAYGIWAFCTIYAGSDAKGLLSWVGGPKEGWIRSDKCIDDEMYFCEMKKRAEQTY